jgi:3-oxoadipate enol-lactonase
MKVAANGINFNYRIDGQDGLPWLMFSNSLATDLTMWDEQAAYFSPKFRVLRYDQRGHGMTEAPAGRYSFDILIQDAVALMDALGIKQAHFCGLSMGGATAMGLAQQHPERLKNVVVCDSGCASTPAAAQQWEERIVVAQSKGMTALVDSTIERWSPAETDGAAPSHIGKIRQMILATPVNGFVGCAAALADHDFRSTIDKVKNPILFVVGQNDGATPAAMQQLQSQLPGSRFVELPDAGHISNMDRPDAFNRAVNEFLS